MKLDGYELKMTFIQSKKVDRNDWNICRNVSYTFFVIFQRDIHKKSSQNGCQESCDLEEDHQYTTKDW